MRAQKQQNVTQRKGGIQQEIEYADLCKTIQNSGRWELDSNKRNTNQVATEDEKSVENNLITSNFSDEWKCASLSLFLHILSFIVIEFFCK